MTNQPVSSTDLLAAESALRATFACPTAPRGDIIAGAERYLRSAFADLIGLEQLWAHYHPQMGRTTDPLEHTLEVLAELDLAELSERDRQALLWAALFHDVGKVRDSYDRAHARVSAELARGPLERLAHDAALRQDILCLVATHDMLGHFLQGWLAAAHVLAALGWQARLLDLHLRLATADIRSIRGLRHIVTPDQLAAARAELTRALSSERRVAGRGDEP